MKKNARQATKDKRRIRAAIALLPVVDRTLIHAMLPDVSYGTISGRLVDLENEGMLQWADREKAELKRLLKKYEPGHAPGHE